MARFGFEQRQIARQEMQLLPRMLQSIEILQVPLGELSAYLEEAAEENPALCIEAPAGAAPGPPARGTTGGTAATDRHHGWLESQAAPEADLASHLEQQLGMLDLDPELEPWVRLVIEGLDPRGYLSLSDEALLALARERGLLDEGAGDAGSLGRAIATVQGLEPRGVGGRDAIEALLLQLEPDEPDYTLLCRVLEEFLEELSRNRLPGVARSLGIELDHLHALLSRLGELRTAPAAELAGETSPTVRPDVVVERTGRGFEVRVDRSGLPAVTVDPEVEELARDRSQAPEVRRYLRGRLERARWLVEGLAQREETLLRVAQAVFRRQHAFLERGPEGLVPLRMGEVAERLGVHLSTISRAVAGKYADTPYGILPLRSFFPAAAPGAEGVSVGDVQRALRALVEKEDPAAPLSDDELAERLARQGPKIARRTVAKYRKELGIPSSYRRRRHG